MQPLQHSGPGAHFSGRGWQRRELSFTGEVRPKRPRQAESPWFPCPVPCRLSPLGLGSVHGVETPHSQGEGALRPLSLLKGALSFRDYAALTRLRVASSCSCDISFPIRCTALGCSSRLLCSGAVDRSRDEHLGAVPDPLQPPSTGVRHAVTACRISPRATPHQPPPLSCPGGPAQRSR